MVSKSGYFLQTERLGFRVWHDEDFPIALGLWGDAKVMCFIDSRGHISEADVRERLDQEIKNERDHGVQYWPVFLRNTDEHVGCCGLRPYAPEKGIFEFGVHIRSSFWRRGFAAEAASAGIEYAFTVLGAKGLFAGHNPHNTISRSLLEKLGFRYTHDEYYPPTGLNHPSYMLFPSSPGRLE